MALRYKLRTLLIVLALGPPALAGFYLAMPWLLRDDVVFAIVAVAVLLGFFLAAVQCLAWLVVLAAIGRRWLKSRKRPPASNT